MPELSENGEVYQNWISHVMFVAQPSYSSGLGALQMPTMVIVKRETRLELRSPFGFLIPA